MSEVEDIKKRIKDRHSKNRTVLTDYHFSKIYNAMIKSMVILLVVVAIGAYVKVSPNHEYINQYILNDEYLKQAGQWLTTQLSRISFDESVEVSSEITYTHIEDNYYTNMSNEVLNFSKGRVIYIGEQEILGNYITVLLENNVEVTFGNLNDVFVDLYDQIDKGTILGTYNEKVMIIFSKGIDEMDYETFENMYN